MLEKNVGMRPTADEVAQRMSMSYVTSAAASDSAADAQTAGARRTVGREPERTDRALPFHQAERPRRNCCAWRASRASARRRWSKIFCWSLREDQGTIARGRCSERLAGTEAYLPLLEALDNLLQGDRNPAMARAMKELAPTWYAQVVSLSGAATNRRGCWPKSKPPRRSG